MCILYVDVDVDVPEARGLQTGHKHSIPFNSIRISISRADQKRQTIVM